MGACYSKKPLDQESIFFKVQKCIEKNIIMSLTSLTKTEEFTKNITNIDNPYFKIKELRVNALILALFFNSIDCFKYIHETLNASIDSMETLFNEQKTSAIEIICTRNCPDILDYYLPLYENNSGDEVVIEEVVESLNFTNTTEERKSRRIVSTYTPVQKACELGNLNIISRIYKYYKEKPFIPIALDFDYQDETTGENCPLISCRICNYTMIRFLHTTCQANFRLLNKLGENAVQILAAANKKKNFKDFYECFVYLVLNVGVDFTHNYEETLLLLETEKSINFFEKKLKEKGIEIDKYDLEEKYQLIRINQPRPLKEELLDVYQGRDFNFVKLYDDVMSDTDREEISGIFMDSRNTTPFVSILKDLPPN
ncbi:hypothetical protein SteCoe_38011 [Stentor coeruleus]|uniref:DUF3447 domain-containing protein n=1 Tax=Stentor coeruleus TaxID=5963 RepID=A0A1R2ALZ4_9CILI|nr:hypothetical protein SteCoe_38011 [Stentor coeruleus]